MDMIGKLAMVALAMLLCLPVRADAPEGWRIAGSRPADFEFGIDTHVVHAGSTGSGYIRRVGGSSPGFGTLMQLFNAGNYRDTRVRLSAYLKTERAQRGQMWLRIDGPGDQVLGFDNMDARPITNTADWRRYEIVLDVPQSATSIAFGFFLSGSGTVWADDFKLERVDTSVPRTVGDNGARLDEPRNLNFDRK